MSLEIRENQIYGLYSYINVLACHNQMIPSGLHQNLIYRLIKRPTGAIQNQIYVFVIFIIYTVRDHSKEEQKGTKEYNLISPFSSLCYFSGNENISLQLAYCSCNTIEESPPG